MKGKTKIWITIASLFAISMIVIAFGSFIENQKSSDLILNTTGKEIQVNESKAGKLELKDEKEQVGSKAIKLSEKELN